MATHPTNCPGTGSVVPATRLPSRQGDATRRPAGSSGRDAVIGPISGKCSKKASASKAMPARPATASERRAAGENREGDLPGQRQVRGEARRLRYMAARRRRQRTSGSVVLNAGCRKTRLATPRPPLMHLKYGSPRPPLRSRSVPGKGATARCADARDHGISANHGERARCRAEQALQPGCLRATGPGASSRA